VSSRERRRRGRKEWDEHLKHPKNLVHSLDELEGNGLYAEEAHVELRD
jgi:hypothetical protein